MVSDTKLLFTFIVQTPVFNALTENPFQVSKKTVGILLTWLTFDEKMFLFSQISFDIRLIPVAVSGGCL